MRLTRDGNGGGEVSGIGTGRTEGGKGRDGTEMYRETLLLKIFPFVASIVAGGGEEGIREDWNSFESGFKLF